VTHRWRREQITHRCATTQVSICK